MKLKSNKGSIAIFVLVGLLFMSAFLIIMYAANVNKSKTIQEQFNIISGIYSKGNDEESYTDAYTALRKKNRQTMADYSENSATLELTKTFNENMSNYRIYGNSVQDGTPTPDNPVEIQSVGDLITDTTDSNYGKYKIPIKVSGKNLLDMRNAKGGTSGGVTGVVNSDGTVSCSGIATNITINIWLLGDYMQTKELFNLPTGEYYISDCTIFSYDGTTRKSKSGYFEVTEEEYPNGFSVTAVRFKQTKVGTDWNGVMLHPMIERGKVQGEYEQYVEPIIANIYLNEPLRKIGDSADYIDFKTGKVVRNVTELKLDGSVSIGFKNDTVWHINLSQYANELMNGRIFKYYDIYNMKCRGLSNRFIVQCTLYANTDINKIHLSRTGEFISIPLGLFETEDKSGFVNYFKANPTYLLGELEETYEETIDLQELQTLEDYTRIEVLTEVDPSRIEAEYMGYTLD